MTNKQKYEYFEKPAQAIYGIYPYNLVLKGIEYGIEDYAVIQVDDKLYRRKIHYIENDSYIKILGKKAYASEFIKV